MQPESQESGYDVRLGLPSASTFEILAECNGQQQLLKSIPEPELASVKEKPDPLRDSGTRIHRARETGNTLELDANEAELYNSGLNYEKRILDKWKDVFSLTDVKEGTRECRLWLHEPGTLNPICSGQLDVHYTSGNRALIVDWKTGFLSNLVGAKGNWQLRLQAALLNYETGIEDIRVAFAKPKYENSELDYCDYSAIDLKYSVDSIHYILWWSTQPDAQRRAGRHCHHCPAKAHCPEAAAMALLPSQMAKLGKIGRKRTVEVDQLTPDDLLKLFLFKGAITQILESVVARMKSFSDEDLAKIGLQRSKPGELIDWGSTWGAFDALESLGFDNDMLWSCFEPVLGRLAKLAINREPNRFRDEDAAKDWLKEILRPYYTIREGERRLVNLK